MSCYVMLCCVMLYYIILSYYAKVQLALAAAGGGEHCVAGSHRVLAQVEALGVADARAADEVQYDIV